MQLDGSLVQVGFDAVPLGLDPVEVTRGTVHGAVVVVVDIVAPEAAERIAFLRQPHCIAEKKL